MAIVIKISPVDMEKRKALGLKSGDTVRVSQKVKEGEKIRLQVFDGLVLAVKHGSEAGGTFTVRKSIDGIGVERIFPIYSPMIDKIEITRRAKVRRSKLYHIREKAAKEIRRQMRTELTRREPIEVAETPVAPIEPKAEETPKSE